MPGLVSSLLVLTLAVASAAVNRPVGDDDKTPYRWLAEGGVGFGIHGDYPASANLGVHVRTGLLQPGLELSAPTFDGGYWVRSRHGALALDGALGDNGFHGPWAGLRLGLLRSEHHYDIEGWQPWERDFADIVERGWTLWGGTSAGWRWVYHPGFTVGLRAGARVPMLRPPSLHREQASVELGFTLGWADAPGRNLSPGYRSREHTGKIKPEVIIIPAVVTAGLGAFAGYTAWQLSDMSLIGGW